MMMYERAARSEMRRENELELTRRRDGVDAIRAPRGARRESARDGVRATQGDGLQVLAVDLAVKVVVRCG